ncbi:protein kinase [Kitasatospora sp. NPDC058444]|uniref:serine/threonine protein kinase n=1 Tax=Kitasatospora sp. NPDC058444 TaxID=3346504 RepID=UPI00365078AA
MRGTVLAGRYRLVDWLGGGSMGDVWLAEDEVLGRRVAVKVVKPALLDEPGFAERFHAEARVMARLRHPGIVGVYDYGHSGHGNGQDRGRDHDHGHSHEHGATDGRRPVGYLVMELIDGQPLSAVLERRGALPVAEALELALQVLEALETAHESGVVHRDIKPANLMVRGDRTVIADFGVARPACDVRLTVPGMVLGTAAYQAPEQASTGTVTTSADLYALGVVLYECLAGRLPYEGETALEVILKHLTEPVPPLPGDVPAPVRALVERAMAKEPGERWPDAATMAAAVRRALAAAEDAPPTGPARPGPRPIAARVPRATRRLRALAGVTALTLLCVGGAAGATVVRPGGNGAPQAAALTGPTAGLAVPGAPASAEAVRPPAGQPSSPAVPPVPSAGPGTGESPASAAAPTTATAPATGRTAAAPPPVPSPLEPPPTAPAAPAPAAGGNPATPAPTSAAPSRPAPGEAVTPTASATPTQPAPPTQQPKPQLPVLAQITGTNGALDNYRSADQDGNMVGTYVVNGTSAQLWQLDKVAEGMYYLRNAASNYTKVLDQDRKSGFVRIWTSPPSGWNQVWAIVPVTGGFEIHNVESKLCLTSEGIGAGAQVTPCSSAPNQVWTFG